MTLENPKQIWVGPVLGTRRGDIIERCASMISDSRANAFLYLAASHPLLEMVTSKLLDGERNRGVWGAIPVHLFRGFVRHVLETAVDEETGLRLTPRIAIDREEFPLKRSFLAQLISTLARTDRLGALAPLAHSEGVVNTIATLLGEIQRAARTPVEFAAILEARARDFSAPSNGEEELPAESRQSAFDRDIALIYSSYIAALEQFHLTEDDADQVRALSVLRGEVDGRRVRLPLLGEVRLLVLDGFFDFTPIQGEMLRLLIPRIPEVIVNFNRDERNPGIFRPNEETIRQICSMADFEIHTVIANETTASALDSLKTRLFNPESAGPSGIEVADQNLDAAPREPEESSEDSDPGPADAESRVVSNIRVLECGDRETELRNIAKEIKRLVLIEGYGLSDIALVIRQQETYADAINRVFADEAIPCTLERRMAATEAPSVRAGLKLFQLLRDIGEGKHRDAKAGDLADLLKSEYFRPAKAEVAELRAKFDLEREALLKSAHKEGVKNPSDWDVDEAENVIAFVGSELCIDDWLTRAQRLARRIPRRPRDDSSDDGESEADGMVALDAETESAPEPPLEIEQAGSQVGPRLSREVHPVAIAWAATLIDHVIGLIEQTPLDGPPLELRRAVLLLMEKLQFAAQIRERGLSSEADLPRSVLDWRGLESIRRAFAAAIRSFDVAGAVSGGNPDDQRSIKLATLLDEVMRCLRGQTMRLGGQDRDGVKVLEATDVRGLSFRAVFIAGLIEGGFPLRTPRDWIYPHEEREQLRIYGLTLEDISPDTLLKEEHYFYQAACRATERLYLARPLVLEGDVETVASYYIEEVKQAAPAELATETVRRDFDGRKLFAASTKSELAMSLVRQSERHRHSAQRGDLLPQAEIDRLISWAQRQRDDFLSFSALARIGIERKRAGKRFTVFDGEIKAPQLRQMLSDQFGHRHAFSASELSLYGKCPFKFYAERVLGLEPRGEAAIDLKALDAGRLLHDVLRRFLERHRLQNLSSHDREAIRNELQEVADEVFDEHEREVPPLNPQVWRIDREIRKVLLEQVLAYEIKLQDETSGMRPAFFELGFGMDDDEGDPHSTRERLQWTRIGDHAKLETVQIRGRIDRIDVAPDRTVIAYDYKLSRGAGLEDMREGRDLQIGIYLAAIERLFLPDHEIAGGGYYVLRGKQDRRNRGLYRSKFGRYTKLGPNVASSLSDEEWTEVREEMEERTWKFIDGIRAGRFRVKPSAPKDTCPRCDFADVCRYEAFRIRGKK